MMDIPDSIRVQVVEKKTPKAESDPKTREIAEETIDDDKIWLVNEDGCTRNLKRSIDEDFMNSKKRRKQLKPVKIAANTQEMVKVPKQIVGLNNDLGNVENLPHTVPKRLSPLVTDVRSERLPPPLESSAGQRGSETVIDGPRSIDKPEITDLHVPNVEMGPNYVTNPHFLFPFVFQPVKSGAFWSEANLKIFNQEAYCELCKKEFCNKYFLKTHKANKHGIYTDVPTSTGKIQCKDAISGSATKQPIDNDKISGEMDCATAFCNLCNKRFCNKYFVKRHKSKSHGLAEEDAQSFLSQEMESTIVQNSANQSTNKQDSLTVDAREAFTPLPAENDSDNQKHSPEEVEQCGPLNLIVNVKDGENEEEPNDIKDEVHSDEEEDDCSSENIEKLQTMLLRLHPSDKESGKICAISSEAETPSEGCDKKDKDYLSEGNESSNESKPDFGGLRTDNNEYSFTTKLENHPRQMKPTSSYCEICNKELCNKYFMRTHMQRMHGIEIEHGTQIGGVVCNICNKELCSKYFLRVHKQNTHGITSPNSAVGPSTSGNATGQRTDVKTSRGDPRFSSTFTQVCYICNKRFRSPKWLQAHFISDHSDEVSKIEPKDTGKEKSAAIDEELSSQGTKSSVTSDHKEILRKTFETSDGSGDNIDVISKIFWENSAPSKLFNCPRCPFRTSVLAFLFVHERSHFVLTQEQPEMVKPSVSLQNLIHDKTFWQHKITQQMPECLDLSAANAKYLSLEQNGS